MFCLIFRYETGTKLVLNWLVPNVFWLQWVVNFFVKIIVVRYFFYQICKRYYIFGVLSSLSIYLLHLVDLLLMNSFSREKAVFPCVDSTFISSSVRTWKCWTSIFETESSFSRRDHTQTSWTWAHGSLLSANSFTVSIGCSYLKETKVACEEYKHIVFLLKYVKLRLLSTNWS